MTNKNLLKIVSIEEGEITRDNYDLNTNEKTVYSYIVNVCENDKNSKLQIEVFGDIFELFHLTKPEIYRLPDVTYNSNDSEKEMRFSEVEKMYFHNLVKLKQLIGKFFEMELVASIGYSESYEEIKEYITKRINSIPNVKKNYPFLGFEPGMIVHGSFIDLEHVEIEGVVMELNNIYFPANKKFETGKKYFFDRPLITIKSVKMSKSI